MPSPYLKNLNDNPDWQREIEAIKKQVPVVPDWHPEKPVDETTHAYYTGMVAGWNLLLRKLGAR